MSFGIPVRNGLAVGLLASTFLSSLRIGGRPAMFLNFIGTNSLDSRVTFTRASTATFVGSNGVIQSAAINAPRFDYDPATLAAKGLLFEDQRANLLLNSLLNGAVLSTQSVTVTAVSHTISFYGTGTITLTGAATATVTGTGVYPNRRTLTFTPIVGVLLCTVTGSVQYAQLEVGAFATSFIPTAGTAVTRNADVALMTGTNFSSWYNAIEGTVVANFDTYAPSVVDGFGRVYQIDNATNNNTIALLKNNGFGSQYFGYVAVAGAGQATLFTSAISANTPAKVATAYKLNDFAQATNGGSLVTDTSGTIPTVSQMRIGSISGVSSLNGHIRQISYYNTRLLNSQLQTLTQ